MLRQNFYNLVMINTKLKILKIIFVQFCLEFVFQSAVGNTGGKSIIKVIETLMNS
jgi:hypothetical protein